MTELYQRDQYMKDGGGLDVTPEERMAVHRRYFAQFVSRSTIDYVVASIGAEAIKASTKPHMNDIPLAKWDRMHKLLPIAIPLAAVGETNTTSTTVCIAKEAARQFKENAENA